MLKFVEWLKSLNLRHFKPSEFLIGLDRGNTLPPPDLWPNLIMPAHMLDRMRAVTGRPIHITSCYRSPEYNARVGGEPLSQHMACGAIDFKVDGMDPATVAGILRSWRGLWVEVRDNPERVPLHLPAGEVPYRRCRQIATGGGFYVAEFRGGVGQYPTFTHLDARGYDVDF